MPWNVLKEWPTWLSRWLGYRAPSAAPPNKTNYVVWIWSFIGAFAGLSVLQAIFTKAEYFLQRKVPPIIASYGASAVLIYGAIESPLAQPRALLSGHFIASLIGVCITKLFSLLHNEQRFEELRWLAGSLSTAMAIVVMQITETTHPPAGASALLAAVSPEITQLGWYYLPIILLSSSVAFVVALIVNNVQRRYPQFWFVPTPPPKKHIAPQLVVEKTREV
ncbi:hypothetical protein BDM02DRAFT_3155800 [Thelephora ganbajun]|uniref:Uncharacterized protein n=1 Tax=Thelephora ganbajun TaxID=370292 RepID=A0ACB6ZFW7_THEGA|nr:hypothetical protein BDM02DRAFT_3155800 [Thelephora ganbajun]